MESLARQWSEMLQAQLTEGRQKGVRRYLSEKVYGADGAEETRRWMEQNCWDKPWKLCSCEYHCAEK
ncbi:hypothetical protein M407DRAFT_244444 [Tulasnella calospora MUT 4182]|uniref:Uncharacterized protein n=1 Tax=Tulasnella calospora MUT 4182 TaxID=1051891 RepID=A0A0C3QES4_9AGAM|nr:hypothetical protein M407DRAFT_244444 [Tulasnella calospora MUT 4182]